MTWALVNTVRMIWFMVNTVGMIWVLVNTVRMIRVPVKSKYSRDDLLRAMKARGPWPTSSA